MVRVPGMEKCTAAPTEVIPTYGMNGSTCATARFVTATKMRIDSSFRIMVLDGLMFEFVSAG